MGPTQTVTRPTFSPARYASTALIVGAVGLIWIEWGLTTTNLLAPYWPAVAAVLGVLLLGYGMVLRSQAFASGVSRQGSSVSQRQHQIYTYNTAAEIVLAFVAAWALNQAHHAELIASVVAAIVALHFFVMGFALRGLRFYVEGAVMLVGDVALTIALQGNQRLLAIALMMGIVLWIADLIILATLRGMLRQAR